ncbi:MAG TPA: ATP-binding protein [Acetobacteraceae bacterium]|nr:ATP-binding protein [Acetobacteraceae bacterium]
MQLPAQSEHWIDLLPEPAALVACPDGAVLLANTPFTSLLDRDAAAGSSTPLSRLVCPAEAPALDLVFARQDSVTVALRFVAPDNTSAAVVNCHFGPIRSGCRLLRLARAADASAAPPDHVADLEAQAAELRQKLAWFREAIDKVGHSVVVFDAKDRLVLCNKFYRAGYRAGDRVLPPEIALEGKTYRELMELRVQHKLHKEFADDPEAFIEDRMRRFEEGGDSITYLANGSVVRSQYRRLAGGNRVYIGTDITKLMEQEEQQRATELAYRTKSQFLANMSHELRTPLNAILGFSELIRDATVGPVDARYRSFAEDIHSAGQHLLSLINDILDLSKVEVGRMVLRDSTVDLADLVRKCCRLVHERAREDKLTLEQNIPADLPCVVADELRLKQILLNLLSNAIKFSLAGGRVHVFAARQPDGGLNLSVADTGIGMSAEEIDLALTPFHQVDRGFGRGYEGTGLGLPLAKTLTELHGARFEIESAPGAGTVVTIAMPPERVLPGVRHHARGGAA